MKKYKQTILFMLRDTIQTVDDVAEELGVSKSVAQSQLDELVADKLISATVLYPIRYTSNYEGMAIQVHQMDYDTKDDIQKITDVQVRRNSFDTLFFAKSYFLLDGVETRCYVVETDDVSALIEYVDADEKMVELLLDSVKQVYFR